MHAIQRRSGAIRLVPDEFVITSLDVIIREDDKLGEGGYGQVFRGDWQGVVVAVKVFEKGIAQPVRAVFKPEIVILINGDVYSDLTERARCVEASSASTYPPVSWSMLDRGPAVCRLRIQIKR